MLRVVGARRVVRGHGRSDAFVSEYGRASEDMRHGPRGAFRRHRPYFAKPSRAEGLFELQSR